MKALLTAALALGIFMAFSALSPGFASAADGTITGLSLSPSPSVPTQIVTVTVQGTETCKKLDVDFGDQSPVATLDNADLDDSDQTDNSATHVYMSVGSYTVTATPVEQCTGSAQKTLTVEVPGGGGSSGKAGQSSTLAGTQDVLCAILDNCPIGPARSKRMILLDPQITGVFFGPITPGAKVMLFGNHFGSQGKPQLKLHLKTDNQTLDLPVFDWSRTMVAGTIPASLSGVHDQPAEFEIVRADNKPSNPYGVTFTAIHAVRQLKQDEVRIVQCPSTSNCDRCNATRHEGCSVQSAFESSSIVGSHSNCGFCVGDDSGTDIYEINLKNGWVIEDYDYTGYWAPGEATLSMPSSAPLGASSWKPSFKWSATPSDGLHYWAKIYIEGPRGLPYR